MQKMPRVIASGMVSIVVVMAVTGVYISRNKRYDIAPPESDNQSLIYLVDQPPIEIENDTLQMQRDKIKEVSKLRHKNFIN